MAVFVAVLIMVGTLGGYLGTRGIRSATTLVTTFGLQALAIGCLLAGVDYLARAVLEQPSAAAILFACFVGPALVVTPIWQRVAGALGKKRGYLISSLVLAARPTMPGTPGRTGSGCSPACGPPGRRSV